jgi:Raf kinase inhibitor-like YbhB/YbcL family protein
MRQTHLLIRFGLLLLILAACSPTPTQAPTAAPAPTQTELPSTAVPSATPAEPTATVIPSPEPTATLPGPFTLSSPAFQDGQELDVKYVFKIDGQCQGENYSPPLAWSGVPNGTQSFALTVVDPDGGNWVHWLQFNLPATATSLPEAINGPDLGLKGRNDFGENSYGGPCPPGGIHHYIFTLYALDTNLELQAGANLKAFQAAIQGHSLAEAKLTGLRTAP